jgi:hypothetical protein
VRQKLVQVLVDLARDDVGPPALVVRAAQERQEDALRNGGERLQRRLGQLAVQHLARDLVGVERGAGLALDKVDRLALAARQRVVGLFCFGGGNGLKR